MPAALFGITNDGLNLAVNLLVLFLIVTWIALVAWTYFDARRRLEDPVLVMCATGASLFPFAGTMVYSILRPPEFLEDKRERELEIKASEMRLRQLRDQSCPHCEYPVERSYLRCPNCKARIHDPCESCGKPIDPRWSLCPYCETPVRQAAPPRAEPARARKPRETREAAPAPAASSSGAPRKRARTPAATRQTRSPRPATQRATNQRQQSRATSEGPPASAGGEDEPRPAPAGG
jgi:Double zinc ribbon